MVCIPTSMREKNEYSGKLPKNMQGERIADSAQFAHIRHHRVSLTCCPRVSQKEEIYHRMWQPAKMTQFQRKKKKTSLGIN